MVKNEVLYHYTSVAGLNNIIRSRKVWASDCRYLNDQNELVHAIDLFLSKYDGDTKTKEILSLALHWQSFSRSHCVFSLSRSPRVLSQWRAYGDDGRGAAIGFSRKHLMRICEINSHALVDCIYDNHESFLDSIAVRCSKDIQALLKMYSDSDGALNSFWNLVNETPTPIARIYRELLSIKNSAFQEEQEVRLVISIPSEQVQTRVARGLIIPYVEQALVDKGDEEAPLWMSAPEIWLGPRCDKRNLQALQVFRQFGWTLGLHQYDCGYI